jgi:hypothetical protein
MKFRVLAVACLALLAQTPLFAHGMSEQDKQAMLDGGYLQYLGLGATHMLTGYDHLLFLFGVIFFLTNFRDVVKFVTAFTLGHCITLIFATYAGISANYYLVDAVIALTVIYKGFDNVDGFNRFLGRPSPNLLTLVFTFGLIHGFGLSTRLQQLPLGDDGLLLRILSFNLGVEIGQVLALAAMVVLLSAWRHTASFLRFSTAMNVGLMIAGMLLFLMQTHGLLHEANVDDMPFSMDAHAHAHKTMRAPEAAKAPAVANEVARPVTTMSQAEFDVMAEKWIRAKQEEYRRQQESAHGHRH